jgi:hypothetical protein
MNDQTQQLAGRFERANQAVIEIVESADEEQLRAICEGEGCTVAALGYHVAGVHGLAAGWARDVAEGRELPALNWDMLHDINAEQFAANADRGRDEVLALLRHNGQAALHAIRGFSKEELSRSAWFPLFERQMTTADMIEGVLIYDVESHLPSMQAAVDKARQPELTPNPA